MQVFLRSTAAVLILASNFIPDTAFAKILALGDSLTFGYEVDASLTWPKLLEKNLDIPVINAGTSGATTAFGIPTLRFHLKRYTPTLVIYALGANDGLRGMRPEVTESNIEKVIEQCKDKGVPFVLLGMKAPPNYGRAYTEAFEAIYPRLAKKHKVPLLPFMLEGVAGVPKYNQPDGIHPNAEGYKIISENILKVVKKNYVKKTDSKPRKGS